MHTLLLKARFGHIEIFLVTSPHSFLHLHHLSPIAPAFTLFHLPLLALSYPKTTLIILTLGDHNKAFICFGFWASINSVFSDPGIAEFCLRSGTLCHSCEKCFLLFHIKPELVETIFPRFLCFAFESNKISLK